MQTSRFIDFSAFFFYRKILADSSQELFRRQAIQVFYNTVVINNGQLVSRETNGHEVIIFFITGMVYILLGFLRSYQSGSGTTMVSVGNIKSRHLSKFLRNGINVFLLINNPESMTKAITGSNKIIYRLFGCIMSDNSIQSSIVRICKEYRFDIGIINTNMLHTVFFLIATGQLMFLDDTVHIIRYIGTYY